MSLHEDLMKLLARAGAAVLADTVVPVTKNKDSSRVVMERRKSVDVVVIAILSIG